MAMQLCKYCLQLRDESYFPNAGVIKGKRYRRRKCQRCYHADKRQRRGVVRNIVRDLKKELVCKHCGNNDFRVLQFHHRDKAKKDFNIGDGLGSKGPEAIKQEITKCDVLCANCHAILHWNERNRV